MAGVPVSFVTTEITLGDIATKTILQLYAPTGVGRALIREISLTVNDVPDLGKSIFIEVLRQTSAGSGLITVNGVNLNSDDNHSPDVTALRGKDSGQTEPSSGTFLMQKYVPTLGGEFLWVAIRETDKLPLNEGERIGIRTTSTVGAGYNYKVIAYMLIEE